MAVLDKVLGGLLVGTYANSMLYALEIVAVIRYHSTSKRNRDSVWLQAMVYFTFVVDTVSTISACAGVYLYSITYWGINVPLLTGNINHLQRQLWPSTVSLVTHGISATIVQCFLIYRYWRMSEHNYITLALILSMFTALGGWMGTIVSHVMYRTLEKWDRPVLSATIWVSTSAATDSIIALVLLWELSRNRSPFGTTQGLMPSAICTGTMTSVVAILTLILFLTDKQSNVSDGFAYCLARIYALTMLYNLNNGTPLMQRSTNANKTTSSNTTEFATEIYVHRTEYRSSTHDVLDFLDPSKDDPNSPSARGKVSVVSLTVN